MLVEQLATACSFFAIDNANFFSCQIVDAADLTAGSRDQALFPDRERHHFHGSLREKMLHDRQIVIASGGIAQMGSGDMHLSLLQPLQGLTAGAGGDYD